MPPRSVVALIVLFWVGSIVFLIYEEYYPWWRTDAPPPFLVELADEASPLSARWSIYRGDQKIGSANTVMTCLRDDSIELASTIENLELSLGLPPIHVHVRIVKQHTIQRVTRDGQLLTLNSRMHLVFTAVGQRIEVLGDDDLARRLLGLSPAQDAVEGGGGRAAAGARAVDAVDDVDAVGDDGGDVVVRVLSHGRTSPQPSRSR